MAIAVEMPKLGNTVEECLLAKWAKKPGDTVAEGDLLAEIETDKATFELNSPAAGTILATFFDEGSLVPVYVNVCAIGTPGEDIESLRPRKAPPKPVDQPQSVKQAPQPTAAPTEAVPAAAWSPRARRFAREHGFTPENVPGSGPGGRVLEADVRRAFFESPRPTSLARKHIESGYEPRAGATGRFLRTSDLTPPAAKMSNIRERIARRMRESLSGTAQYTMSTSADATGLVKLRAAIKAHREQKGWPDININELITFAVIQALRKAPEVNVELADGKLRRHEEVNIGFACDTEKGLLVPVVKNAEKLTLPGLALQIKELTRQALEGAISPDDLTGGTFTVSNLGMYGVESFTPILNAPQVAILGVNAITLKPVRRSGQVEFVDHIGLSLTCDHQVIDGAPGARFLKLVREEIENIEHTAALEV